MILNCYLHCKHCLRVLRLHETLSSCRHAKATSESNRAGRLSAGRRTYRKNVREEDRYAPRAIPTGGAIPTQRTEFVHLAPPAAAAGKRAAWEPRRPHAREQELRPDLASCAPRPPPSARRHPPPASALGPGIQPSRDPSPGANLKSSSRTEAEPASAGRGSPGGDGGCRFGGVPAGTAG